MLVMNQVAVDRMEKLFNRYTCLDDREFLKDIVSYVKEGDYPIRELEFSFRIGDEKDTIFKCNVNNEKLNGIQNKSKNEKAWRIYLAIAEMYRSVKTGEGKFFMQDSGDAWYFADHNYEIGTYMVPYSVLDLIMSETKDQWETKEISNVDRERKAKEENAEKNGVVEKERAEYVPQEADEEEFERTVELEGVKDQVESGLGGAAQVERENSEKADMSRKVDEHEPDKTVDFEGEKAQGLTGEEADGHLRTDMEAESKEAASKEANISAQEEMRPRKTRKIASKIKDKARDKTKDEAKDRAKDGAKDRAKDKNKVEVTDES